MELDYDISDFSGFEDRPDPSANIVWRLKSILSAYNLEHDLLYIDGIEILPKYQNKGIGTAALKTILSHFDNVGIYALCNYGPEYELRISRDWDEKMGERMHEKGEKYLSPSYWRRLGFDSIDTEDLFFASAPELLPFRRFGM